MPKVRVNWWKQTSSWMWMLNLKPGYTTVELGPLQIIVWYRRR